MRRLFPSVCVLLLGFAGCAETERPLLEWQHTGGPLAQDVAWILADAEVPGQLFAVLHNGDFFLSQNEGTDWRKISTIRPWKQIHRLVQDPERGEIIYAATEGGLYVTRNRGGAWEAAGATPAGQVACRTLAIDPWTTSTLYLGTREHGVWKSTDRGVHWEDAAGSDSILRTADVLDIAVDPTRPDAVIATSWGLGVFRSTDGGSTWERIAEESTAAGSVITHLALHPKMRGVMLYATDAGTIARTTNGGGTWSTTKRDDEAWRVLNLTSDPQEPDLLFAGTESGIFRSGDFGTTWTRVIGGLPRLPTSIIPVKGRTGRVLFAYGAGIGVQASRDEGETWSHADADLGGATITFVASDPSGENLFAATGTALLRYDAGKRTWDAASSGLSGGSLTSIAFDPDSAGIMTATSTGGAFRSTNGGSSWSPIARNVRMMPRFLDTHPAIRTRMMASGLQGAFVSTDRGNSWFQAKPAGNTYSFRSLTFTPRNAGIIHAATTSQGVIMTNDGGLSWEPARYGLSSDSIFAITLDDVDGLTYFAWTSAGDCFRSTNKGLEWSKYAPPWSTPAKIAIAFDRLRPSSVVAIINGQDLYFSPTGGTSWIRVPVRPQQMDITALYWNGARKQLFAGTRDQGVHLMDLRTFIASAFEE